MMKINNRFTRLAGLAFFAFLLSVTTSVSAQTFSLPAPNEAVLGSVTYISSSSNMSAPLLARDYNIGQNALIAANSGVVENGQLPDAPSLTVPTRFMLPPLPRHGIVINLPEMRMYYYPAGTNTVMTFPIGIGKIGKTIPIRNTSIIRKVVNPTWIPPEDIRAFNREQGIELPRKMGPGPDNPLGPYAIYLQIPTYLIHSTIFPESIGRRASFGCIRMNEDDIKQFFPLVTPGTPVLIVDMPIKVAWQDEGLYMESHPSLEERNSAGIVTAVKSVQQALPHNEVVLVNWELVSYLSKQPDGLPHEIAVRVG
jgi:L,D-transpeptidase ErfK/SrfK